MPVTPKVTCENCKQRCDDKSLGTYPRPQYYINGEALERLVARQINEKGKGRIECTKSGEYAKAHTLPDLEIRVPDEIGIVARLEVKHITRAFMNVENCLREANLVPWETIAVNTAKIRRYAKNYAEEGVLTHLVWCIDRACLPGSFFFQDILTLNSIVNQYGKKREFKRQGQDGDTIAFHFSVNELMPFNIDHYMNSLFPSYSVYADADAPSEDFEAAEF
jgi:hypothetical protein